MVTSIQPRKQAEAKRAATMAPVWMACRDIEVLEYADEGAEELAA